MDPPFTSARDGFIVYGCSPGASASEWPYLRLEGVVILRLGFCSFITRVTRDEGIIAIPRRIMSLAAGAASHHVRDFPSQPKTEEEYAFKNL